MESEAKEQLKLLGRVGAVGAEMVAATCLGYFGGGWLGDVLGTGPWLRWVGLGLGLGVGFWGLYRVAQAGRRALEGLANDGTGSEGDDRTERDS